MKLTGVTTTAQKVYTAVTEHRTRNAAAAHAHIKQWNAVHNLIPDFPDQPPVKLSKAGYIDTAYVPELKRAYKVLKSQHAVDVAQRPRRTRAPRPSTVPPSHLAELVAAQNATLVEIRDTMKALLAYWVES